MWAGVRVSGLQGFEGDKKQRGVGVEIMESSVREREPE